MLNITLSQALDLNHFFVESTATLNCTLFYGNPFSDWIKKLNYPIPDRQDGLDSDPPPVFR
ncbi:hypothetical protein [Pedobacter steynii]|nr:hypothetical protein [Pedobacter steynii]